MNHSPSPPADNTGAAKVATQTVLVVLLLYTGLVVAFLGISPSWIDEIEFVDPAANLYFHGQFVASVAPQLTVHDLFCGLAPLHSLLLFVWYHLVGFGLFQSRLLSWIFAAVGLCAALAAIYRSRILPVRNLPWLAILFLTGFGITVAIWNTRYDTLDFMLIAIIAYGLTSQDSVAATIARRTALFLITLASYHTPFVIAFLYALTYWGGGVSKRTAFVDIAYMIGGGLAQFAFYGITVGPGRFVFLTVFNAGTVLGQAARGAASGHLHDFFITKIAAVANALIKDPSYVVVLIAVLALAFISWRRAGSKAFSKIQISLAIGAVVQPLFLCLIGKYAIYYSWIGWSCLCVLFFSCLDEYRGRPRLVVGVIAIVCLVSAALGTGRYVYDAITTSPTSENRAQVLAAIDKFIKPGEIVYADDAVYFEAKQRARYVYTEDYAQTRTVPGFPTVAPVTTIIAQDKDLPKVKSLVGGKWNCVWQTPGSYGSIISQIKICSRL